MAAPAVKPGRARAALPSQAAPRPAFQHAPMRAQAQLCHMPRPAVEYLEDALTAEPIEARLSVSHEAYFDGQLQPTPIYDRDRLPRSASVAGPAVVEEMGSVTIVPQHWRLNMGKLGELHMRHDTQVNVHAR